LAIEVRTLGGITPREDKGLPSPGTLLTVENRLFPCDSLFAKGVREGEEFKDNEADARDRVDDETDPVSDLSLSSAEKRLRGIDLGSNYN
jgi:hypothetical protein